MKQEIPPEDAYRLINPGCVVLVTCAYRDKINIMPLAWQSPLSKRPPLVGIAVAQSHFTFELIAASEQFAINIPAAGMLKQVLYCGKISGREKNKFETAGLTPVKGRKICSPLLKECIGHLECGVVDRYKVGDHYLFIGEVLAAAAQKNLFTGYWSDQAEMIHHLGGKLFYLSGHRQEAKD